MSVHQVLYQHQMQARALWKSTQKEWRSNAGTGTWKISTQGKMITPHTVSLVARRHASFRKNSIFTQAGLQHAWEPPHLKLVRRATGNRVAVKDVQQRLDNRRVEEEEHNDNSHGNESRQVATNASQNWQSNIDAPCWVSSKPAHPTYTVNTHSFCSNMSRRWWTTSCFSFDHMIAVGCTKVLVNHARV